MAEIKRASPSQGVIRENFAPVQLARELSEAGAAAISVLTEPDYFHGSLRYLRMIADNVELPLLRKDFIVDSYQVYEARLAGADAILLIAAALDPVEFARLSRLARELRLAVLVEVHSEEELKWALEAAPDLVGVNSRNLSTFETDLPAAAELLKKIPAPIVRVAESGLRNRRDIEILRQAGADAFLVGESLMRSRHPGEKLRQMAEINPAGAHTANQP